MATALIIKMYTQIRD